MPRVESMPLAYRKQHPLNPKGSKIIHPKHHSVIDVAQGDYAMVANDKDVYLYIDTRGAGPCIAIAIRTAEQTLVAHMDMDTKDVKKNGQKDDKAARTVGTRANQNLHEILEKMLDLVSQDRSKIESIGLLSTAGGLKVDGDGNPVYGNSHADEVMKYLWEEAGLSEDCVIHLGTRQNDLIVQLKHGTMMEMGNQVKHDQYVNVDQNGDHTGTYPKDVTHAMVLELALEDNEEIVVKPSKDKDNEQAKEMASAANEDDSKDEKDEKDDNAPPETVNDDGTPSLEDNAQADQMLSADNNGKNDNAVPELENANNDSGGGASNEAASPDAEMGGGMNDMNNELDMNNEMME